MKGRFTWLPVIAQHRFSRGEAGSSSGAWRRGRSGLAGAQGVSFAGIVAGDRDRHAVSAQALALSAGRRSRPGARSAAGAAEGPSLPVCSAARLMPSARFAGFTDRRNSAQRPASHGWQGESRLLLGKLSPVPRLLAAPWRAAASGHAGQSSFGTTSAFCRVASVLAATVRVGAVAGLVCRNRIGPLTSHGALREDFVA